MQVPSPAKVNLHLEIGPVEDSGLHQLRSLFHLIGLQDTLYLTIDDDIEGFQLICRGYQIPEENTLKRAYAVFREAAGRNFGCRAELIKRIPPGSGLGGGSSNAAAVLAALNSLTGSGLTQAQLKEAGSTVGSDVPFFLQGVPCAFVEGTGEQVSEVPSSCRLPALIIMPDVRVSTRWAYAALDEMREDPRSYTYQMGKLQCIREFQEKDPSEWAFKNSFLPLVEKHWPDYRNIREVLQEHHVSFEALSGSGAAVVGIFRHLSRLYSCKTELKRSRYWVKYVKMLANSPFAVYNEF